MYCAMSAVPPMEGICCICDEVIFCTLTCVCSWRSSFLLSVISTALSICAAGFRWMVLVRVLPFERVICSEYSS